MSVRIKRIEYSKKFEKQLKKSPIEIKIAFRKRLSLFIRDQFHPALNNHALTGKLRGLRSINITGDWRAIYLKTKDDIIFVLIGTHGKLYK